MAPVSLFDLQRHIRQVIALNFREPVWVAAEIAAVSKSKGHYYLNLIQKNEGEEMLAQADAVLWAGDLKRLSVSPEALLRAGLAVKLLVTVDYHERYGMKLQITDIDAAYTFGQLALERQKTLDALRKKGLLEKNRQQPLKPVLQRIAIISSPEAAGYQDFRKHLADNHFEYAFHCRLFPALVQGQEAANTMIAALLQIKRLAGDFDCVVIIRGGGAKTDLLAFDDMALCQAAADAPLPVLTGIGHDIDESLLDRVVHTALKTPTAVADFLIHHNLAFESNLHQLASLIAAQAGSQNRTAQMALLHIQNQVEWAAQTGLRQKKAALQALSAGLPVPIKNALQRRFQYLEQLETVCNAFHPDRMLSRGFSLTTKNGRVLTNAADLAPGDILETRLQKGSVRSKVT